MHRFRYHLDRWSYSNTICFLCFSARMDIWLDRWSCSYIARSLWLGSLGILLVERGLILLSFFCLGENMVEKEGKLLRRMKILLSNGILPEIALRQIIEEMKSTFYEEWNAAYGSSGSQGVAAHNWMVEWLYNANANSG